MPETFGQLLRRLRIAHNLSQEALSEAASISTSAVGAYERGLSASPHRETVRLLADVLELSGQARTEFENAARRKPTSRRSAGKDATESTDNLQVELSSFIGRNDDMNEVADLLTRNRVVTIIGPGGIGKTRLALEVALGRRRSAYEGMWFVDFASIRDPLLIESRIASIVNVTLTSSKETSAALANALGARNVLLILDNCEHLLEPIGNTVTVIVGQCPNVRILATSRERLRLRAEAVYRLAPLTAPSRDPSTTAEALAYTSIKLFVDRAERSDQRFELTSERVPAIAEICRRLDGIPLAIELAAAQLPALGLRGLQEEITARLADLPAGTWDLPARQKTLRATLDWSFSLLDDREALLFQRISAFDGGCTLAAVKAVCVDSNITDDDLIALLSSLVEKSLVFRDYADASPRYSLLESARLFARRKLKESADAARLARRQAEWCAAFADNAEFVRFTIPSYAWNKLVGAEFANIYQAVAWAVGTEGDVAIAGRIIGGLRGFWAIRGRIQELLDLVEVVRGSLDEQAYPAVAATVYLARSFGSRGDEYLKRAAAIRESLGDLRGLFTCLFGLANFYSRTGNADALEQALGRAIDLARTNQLTYAYPLVLVLRADIDIMSERYYDAYDTLTEAYGLMEAAGTLECSVVLSLAQVEFRLGMLASAVERTERYAAEAFSMGDVHGAVAAQVITAQLRLALGDVPEAAALARTALRPALGASKRLFLCSLVTLATVAALTNRPSRAARLYGFVGSENTCGNINDDGCSACTTRDRLQGLLIEQLGESKLLVYCRQGATLTDEVAMHEALGD